MEISGKSFIVAAVAFIIVAVFFVFLKSNYVDFEQAFDDACGQLRSVYRCDLNQLGSISVAYKSLQAGNYTLAQLCRQKVGRGKVVPGSQGVEVEYVGDCAVACGCPRTTR